MTTVFDKVLGSCDTARPFLLGETTRSYGDLIAAAGRVAAALGGAGCEPGARVGVCFDQGLEYVASLFGVWQAGAITVLMSPDWTASEKARVLEHAEARLALADMPALTEGEPRRSTALPGLEAYLLEHDIPAHEPAAPGDAVIIYTSGTTGLPKGVVLSADAVTANAAAVAEYLGLGPGDSAPILTPTCYAYSLSQNLTHAVAGAAIFPVPTGLMFPMEVLQGIAVHRLTGMAGTPTLFRMLTDLDPDPTLDLTSMRYVMTGGQPLDAGLVGAIGSLFPRTRVVNMYGCTENSPRVSYHWLEGERGMDARGYFAVGRPVRGTELRLAPFAAAEGESAASGNEGPGAGDAGTGAPAGAPPGSSPIGEVLIRGTSLMRAYWKDPAATAERVSDGWLNTHDLGYLDGDGLLHLTGRRSTIINVGNEKVSPEEVEKVLLEIPGVREAAVYGVPDPLLGEGVHARVVLEPGARLQAGDLQRHCRDRISGYKLPRRITVAGEIPRTLYGKIDRRRLREEAEGGAS